MTIEGFTGQYRWLSNFWAAEIVTPKGLRVPTVEHLYQALKFMPMEPDMRDRILLAKTPGEAKRLAQAYKPWVRKDWNTIRVEIMRLLLALKFGPQHPELVSRLLLTRDEDLIELNNWGDTFWGVIQTREGRVGENHLGKLLMQRRKELFEEVVT